MPCTSPLQAYRSITHLQPNGTQLLRFKLSEVTPFGPYETVDLPCGQCLSCRISRSKEWALRCVHEAAQWENNCFITLTYKPEALPISTKDCTKCPQKKLHGEICAEGSICKRDFQLFMKRLRKRFKGYEPQPNTTKFPIRYFHCGEYGSKLSRPHHHACVFNFNFPDKVAIGGAARIADGLSQDSSQDVNKLYTSKILSELWPHGFHTIGDMTWQSAAYVARYVTKKINGPEAATHYLSPDVNFETGECGYIVPEYITMSRRPGIGAYWFHLFGKQQYDKDYITHDGIKCKIPSYYDKLYAIGNEDSLKRIKSERRRSCIKNRLTLKQQHLARKAKQTILEQRFKKLMRGIENDPTNVQRV